VTIPGVARVNANDNPGAPIRTNVPGTWKTTTTTTIIMEVIVDAVTSRRRRRDLKVVGVQRRHPTPKRPRVDPPVPPRTHLPQSPPLRESAIDDPRTVPSDPRRLPYRWTLTFRTMTTITTITATWTRRGAPMGRRTPQGRHRRPVPNLPLRRPRSGLRPRWKIGPPDTIGDAPRRRRRSCRAVRKRWGPPNACRSLPDNTKNDVDKNKYKPPN
jgi:hypothetical protein